MFRRIPVCGLAILACWATAMAQGSAGPTFVVASIKPAKPMEPGRMMMGMNGGPGTSSPGQITVTNMNLRDLMANAFSVKSYQISGPDWIDSQRFDISMPPALWSGVQLKSPSNKGGGAHHEP